MEGALSILASLKSKLLLHSPTRKKYEKQSIWSRDPVCSRHHTSPSRPTSSLSWCLPRADCDGGWQNHAKLYRRIKLMIHTHIYSLTIKYRKVSLGGEVMGVVVLHPACILRRIDTSQGVLKFASLLLLVEGFLLRHHPGKYTCRLNINLVGWPQDSRLVFVSHFLFQFPKIEKFQFQIRSSGPLAPSKF